MDFDFEVVEADEPPLNSQKVLGEFQLKKSILIHTHRPEVFHLNTISVERGTHNCKVLSPSEMGFSTSFLPGNRAFAASAKNDDLEKVRVSLFTQKPIDLILSSERFSF